MPDITILLDDGVGGDATERTITLRPRGPFVDGATTVYERGKDVRCRKNVSVVRSLRPGPWEVAGIGPTPIPFTVGTVADTLSNLIAANIGIPVGTAADTISAAVAAYLAAHPPAVEVDEWVDNGNGTITISFGEAGVASPASLSVLAAAPDLIAVGAISHSTAGAATGFAVVWPDGATGTFTGTESTVVPGAIDAYTVTHVKSGVTQTFTQPALTRDDSGSVTFRPAIVVS